MFPISLQPQFWSCSGVLGSSHPLPTPQEFEIELEGSQSLRILCYEKCYDKTKLNKDNNEIVDKIMGKGQIQVCTGTCGHPLTWRRTPLGLAPAWEGCAGVMPAVGCSVFGSSNCGVEGSEVGGHQVMVLGHGGCRRRWDKVRGAFVEMAKPDLPCRGASSPIWAGSVSILLLSVLWPPGGCGEGLELP